MNNKDIRKLNPCYDPNKYYKDTDNYTLQQILKNKKIPAKDRLWVVVRTEFMSDLQLKYYGLGCAKLSKKYTNNKRVHNCINVVEKYLKGKANLEELSAARSAAWTASRSAAWSAAWSAESAARSAARSAAWSAESAESAAWSAESAARSAAWSAESAAELNMEEKQCKLLLKILKEIK